MKVHIGPYPKSLKTKRKIKIEIDDYDCWGADETLAMIILPVLKRLKKKKLGSGMVDNEDVPKNLRSTKNRKGNRNWEYSEKEDELIHKRWDYVMDEMIWAFSEYLKDWERQFHSGKIDLLFEESKENPEFSIMKRGPKDTHKFDRKGYEKHWARIQNGIRLFAKYYSSLWD